MKTVLQKVHKHGFSLNENELRRIVDLVKEQFEKNDIEIVSEEYRVEFSNGLISDFSSLSKVLELDNHSSLTINSLAFKVGDKEKEPENVILLRFTNFDEDEYYSTPIYFSITGSSEDWVHITKSLIEERISKIKKFNPFILDFFFNAETQSKLTSIFGFIAITFLVICGFQPFKYRSDYPENRPSIYEYVISEALAEEIKKNNIESPVEALIVLEQQKEIQYKRYKNKYDKWEIEADKWLKENKKKSAILFFIAGLIFFVPIGLIYSFLYTIKKYDPSYVFLWGDYIEKHKNNRSRINFIYGTILGGLCVSILAGFILNLLL